MAFLKPPDSDSLKPFTTTSCDITTYPYFLHVETRELKHVPADPTFSIPEDALYLPPLPKSTFTSATDTVSLIRRRLPQLTDAVRYHYECELLDDKPPKRTWTVFDSGARLALNNVLELLKHALQAHAKLPKSTTQALKGAFKVVGRAVKLGDRVVNERGSNAPYLELFYEVMPMVLDALKKLMEYFEIEKGA